LFKTARESNIYPYQEWDLSMQVGSILFGEFRLKGVFGS